MLLTALTAIQTPLICCQHSEETPSEMREALPARSNVSEFSQ